MLTFIDHVTLAAPDSEAAKRTFRDVLSFLVIDDGDETVIPFVQGLIRTQEIRAGSDAGAQNVLSPSSSGGVRSFAIRSSDVRGDVKALRERGATITDPVGHGGPNPTMIAGVTNRNSPASPFLIEYVNPSGRPDRAALSQPYAIRSIEEVTILVDNLDEATAFYRREYGMTVIRRLGDVLLLGLPGCRITLARQETAPVEAETGVYSFSLGTTDINGARNTMRMLGVEFRDAPLSLGVAVQIDPALTFGVRINLLQL